MPDWAYFKWRSRSKAESNVNEKKVGKVIKFNKSAYEKKIALKG
jgi:transcription termination factor Rho